MIFVHHVGYISRSLFKRQIKSYAQCNHCAEFLEYFMYLFSFMLRAVFACYLSLIAFCANCFHNVKLLHCLSVNKLLTYLLIYFGDLAIAIATNGESGVCFGCFEFRRL